MKGRNPFKIETKIMKKFFVDDMTKSMFKTDELEAMVCANEILESEHLDVLVYDITDNIKFCVLVTIYLNSIEVTKNVSQFLIDIEKEEIVEADDFDYLINDELLNQLQND